ncbi:hypothetical protein BS50DRAFT_302585 [Corynespora cassiicola Philippines]|uniref:Uncharacterized protein n=1 Tax=Corynespora cassiicola Philippines TaxID=1448308 RepID=A0A2T2NXC3_CORCC|nr:hypothetical protein BS50DRAFT_302585 [Corynespora cassiicola Philippines]
MGSFTHPNWHMCLKVPRWHETWNFRIGPLKKSPGCRYAVVWAKVWRHVSLSRFTWGSSGSYCRRGVAGSGISPFRAFSWPSPVSGVRASHAHGTSKMERVLMTIPPQCLAGVGEWRQDADWAVDGSQACETWRSVGKRRAAAAVDLWSGFSRGERGGSKHIRRAAGEWRQSTEHGQ